MSIGLSSHGTTAETSVRAQANTYVTFTNNSSSAQSYTIRSEFAVSDNGEPDWSKAVSTATAVVLQPGETHQAANANSAYLQVGSAGTKLVSARTKVVNDNSGADVYSWTNLPPEQLIVRNTLNDDDEIIGAN